MDLADFQLEALNRIEEQYLSGSKTAVLLMPVGSGKTTVSMHALQSLAVKYGLDSMAYLASGLAVKSQVQELLQKQMGPHSKKVSVYTYQHASKLIKSGELSQNQFQVVVLDEIGGGFGGEAIRTIFSFFQGYKICFSVLGRESINRIIRFDEKDIVFEYTLLRTLGDGQFLQSQKSSYEDFFSNLSSQFNDIKIGSTWSEQLRDSLLGQIAFAKVQNKEFLKVQELIYTGKIDVEEIVEMNYRMEQLTEFKKLLSNNEYFDSTSSRNNGTEATWQKFFELNPWIFGFGWKFVFNAPLEGKKLEQAVEGYSITGNGKRTDALLRSTGLIQSLCFGEIKTHRTSLIKDGRAYRSESWSISDELAGAIAQIHRTVQKSILNIQEKLSIKDDNGYTLRDGLYLLKPKSVLIIGSLREFRNEHDDIHEDKFSSFELFRRSISDIDIITFDELYARANAIVGRRWNKV